MNSSTLVMQGVETTQAPSREQTDEELFGAYRRTQDRHAFAELVHRYERELYTYLRRYLGDAALAEDAFQSTFLQVHLKCHQFEEGRKFRPWLYTIATNQAIDAQRRNKRHRMVSLDRRTTNESEDDLGSLVQLLESRESTPTAQLESVEREGWTR
ncbi:MAG TPA: sigma-70 family RNA polymerase sigma factor, partial [Pirellulales bacterium]|nr:sigma-70 family RNA polymerase sigma factor [Pirellulales bacterium]